MSIIQAYFPRKEERKYNINRIYDLNTHKVKWESKKGSNLTSDEFDNIVFSSSTSILELILADNQKIPESKILSEYEHFYLAVTSQMFKKKSNYSVVYNTDTNSATFTIMPQSGIYDIYGMPVVSKGGNGRGGRPRRRSTFRQRKVKRTTSKSSRHATHRTRRV
jgi:hypothetical protein